MDENPIILFDGVCNLCNRVVQFVIKHDRQNKFRFASLQGIKGQQLLNQYYLNADDFNSFVLIYQHKAYTKSAAALKVAKLLNGFTSLLYGFIIVPPFIRDAVYNLVAKKRYTWFGKKDSCMVPGKNISDRFLN